MEEIKQTLGGWALQQNIKLLDEKYYDDEKLYTYEEYREIVPRDVEVPISNETWEDRNNTDMEELLKELKSINDAKKRLADREKEAKEKLEKELTDEGYKNDFVTISYSKPSESVSIDTAKLCEHEPELYKELLRDYPKITKRKASFSYRFK